MQWIQIQALGAHAYAWPRLMTWLPTSWWSKSMVSMLISLNLSSPNHLRLTWFMQDGAPPHTTGETIDLLHQLVGHHVISLGNAHEWATKAWISIQWICSFGGAAKGQVYANKPRSLAVLKQEVEDYHHATTPATYRWVVENFGVRIKACLNRSRAHIENVNYKQNNSWTIWKWHGVCFPSMDHWTWHLL